MTRALQLDKYPFRIKHIHGRTVTMMKDPIDEVDGSADFLKRKQTRKLGEIVVEKPIKFSPNAEVIIEESGIIIDTHAWKTLPGGKQVMIRTGGPGELSGNDMRKIDIAIAAAIKDPDRTFEIRRDLVKGYVPEGEERQGGILLDGASTWVSNPSYSAAVNMAVANNVMKGRDRHEGLSPNQLEEIKRFEVNNDPFPKSNMMKATSVMTTFNRGMAKEKFGDKPFTAYRGIYGEQAKTIKARAKRGDTIRIDSNSLASFTTDFSTAKKFKTNLGKGEVGIVIKSKVSYKNVFDSWASNSALAGRFKENEVIASPRGMKITGVIIDD